MRRLFFILLGLGAALFIKSKSRGDVESIDGVDDGRSVMFTLEAENAGKVAIAGTFNSWNASSDPMFDLGDGRYSLTLFLKPGRYHYKYVIDNSVWIHDPKSPQTADDGFGGKMSVIDVL